MAISIEFPKVLTELAIDPILTSSPPSIIIDLAARRSADLWHAR
jgi:hypothetical protein